MDLTTKSKEMAKNILKSLGQENNPASILIDIYIKKELESIVKK
jgi:hypothetical protein